MLNMNLKQSLNFLLISKKKWWNNLVKINILEFIEETISWLISDLFFLEKLNYGDNII